MPPAGRDVALDMYIELVKEDVIKGIRKEGKMNISEEEEKAIKKLLDDDSIIIRPSDKGSGIVIMNKEDYIAKVEKELADKGTYIQSESDTTTNVVNKVKKLAKKLYNEGWISEDMKKYLMPSNPMPGKVKGNPKMHKEGNPLRVIISGLNHPTEKIAELAESELEYGVQHQSTYIKDTTDFLMKIQSLDTPISPDVLLFTMDVKNLYPSVPKEEALRACERSLNIRKEKRIPTEEVLEMIKLVLENNIFEFNNKRYKQIEGTAIGSRLGRNYACTFMGWWEENLLSKQSGNMVAFYRYIDDIIGIWKGGEESFKEFVIEANNIHPKIKVIAECSPKEVNFLDVHVVLENGELKTDIYSKESDQHMYVHSKSQHPSTTKKAIPYGLAIRAKRICSNDADYVKNKNLIAKHMVKRGYRMSHVHQSMKKADSMNRKDLLQYKTRKKNDRVPLVVTFSENLPNVQNILHRRMDILERSSRMKDVYTAPPITAYRRDQNIKDVLVHIKHNKQFRNSQQGSHKCEKECTICQYVKQGCKVMQDEREYQFKDSVTCKTSNLVYGIHCDVCDKIVYVGETGTTLYERMANHISTVNTGKNDSIPKHFNSENHSAENLRWIGIEKIGRIDIHLRKVRESFWIRKLKTIYPQGLNQNGGIGDQDRGIVL